MAIDNKSSRSPVLVRKYGGSSLASVERIIAVAKDICAARTAGHQLVVVVSAMGSKTDELAELAYAANPAPPRRELDMLLSVGERITMSLLSMALAAEGQPAISYTGSQCGIITDTSHTDARIIEVMGDRVRQSLSDGHVVVVAGYQGVSLEKEITTLGRGGSDTTAVALAAALGAERCEILKDVAGVLTADPDLLPQAKRHDALTYDQLREIATSGCGVVHLRAVEYAASHQVPLFVGSSFFDSEGTTISDDCSSHLPTPTASDVLHPLALTVQENLALLSMHTTDCTVAKRWRDLATRQYNECAHIAEWCSDGDDFSWGVLAKPEHLEYLAAQAQDLVGQAAGQVTLTPQLGCLNLAGCQPINWPTQLQQFRSLLVELAGDRADRWQLRADGTTLRALVPDPLVAELAPGIHSALFLD